MRVSAAERAKSQERIVAAASTLLRGGGSAGASVHEVMKAAGLTHGGFYRHFPDKEAMLAAAVTAAFAEFAGNLEAGDDALAAFERLYLSDGHVAHPELGCPAAAAAPDVARAGPGVRTAFGAGLNRMIDAIAARLTGRQRRQRAIRRFALMVGAVVLARASDPDTAAEVLAAVREG